MKVEGNLFAAGVIFFAAITPIYWYLSEDATGTTVLALTFGLSALISFYLLFTARRLPGPRPEDRVDGEISDAAGIYGFYSPHSWWPLAAASAAAVFTLGSIFGAWLMLIGGFMLVVAVIGFVFEYYRGPAADQDR